MYKQHFMAFYYSFCQGTFVGVLNHSKNKDEGKSLMVDCRKKSTQQFNVSS